MRICVGWRSEYSLTHSRRMHSQSLVSTPENAATSIVGKFLKDGDVTAADLRARLQEAATALSPGLRSCSAFDALTLILSLPSGPTMCTALSSMLNDKKLVAGAADSIPNSTSIPENWGAAGISRLVVSSNQSDASMLTDENERTCWQSSGSLPHWIKLYLNGSSWSGVGVIVSREDASYCPAVIRILVGADDNDTRDLGHQQLRPAGTQAVVTDLDSDEEISYIQIKIESNLEGGCNTRVRGVFLKSASGSSKLVWAADSRGKRHRQTHYLEAARGSNEQELRRRFNDCMKTAMKLVTSEVQEPQSSLGSLGMELLSMKIDRTDLDFLASCSSCTLDEFFGAVWKQLETQVLGAIEKKTDPEQNFIRNFASFGRLLTAFLNQIVSINAEANPVACKLVVDAIFSSLSSVNLQAKTVRTKDFKFHLEGYVGLLTSSICSSITCPALLSTLSTPKWQQLLWGLAASDYGDGIRTPVIQLIQSIAMHQKPQGQELAELTARLMDLISVSSPELAVLSEDSDKVVANLSVRSAAVSMLMALLGESWSKGHVTDLLLASIGQAAPSTRFLASVLVLGGRLDVQLRDLDSGPQQVGVPGVGQGCVDSLLKSVGPLLSRAVDSGLEKPVSTKEELCWLVTCTRTVKALWELLPAWKDTAGGSNIVSDLIKLASRPILVPFSCVQTTAGAQGSGSWTWGPFEPNNISILDNGLTARNRSGSGPDYSCVLGSETFTRGVHTWVLEVSNVQALWLGISRGVEQAGGLNSSPGQHGEYQLFFASGGQCSHLGEQPTVETVSSSGTGFSSGQRVKFVLDISARSLTMSVNDDVKYVCTNVDCSAGVVPYMCSDYTESVTIVERSSSIADPPALTLDMLMSKTHAVLPLLKGDYSSGKMSLEDFVGDLELSSSEIVDTTVQKLKAAGITVDDLCSPSLTSDALKGAGITLGPRKALLLRRDKEVACASSAVPPSLPRARSLARMREPNLPLSACVKALAAPDCDSDLALLAKRLETALAVDDDELAKCEDLYRKVGSDAFVKDGFPRAPLSAASPPPRAKEAAWVTRGSPLHLAIDVEQSLLISLSRFLVHDLLAGEFLPRLGAEELERLLTRSFDSIEQPRPRLISTVYSPERMQGLLSASIVAWIKTASPAELEKLQGLCHAALNRYSVLQLRRREVADAKQPADAAKDGQAKELWEAVSEEDSVQSGIGFVLLVLSASVDSEGFVLNVCEALAKCILLTPAEACPGILSAICRSLDGLKARRDFKFGPEMRRALQILRSAIVAMIKKEKDKIRAEVHHSNPLQIVNDCVGYLELLSSDCFDDSGRLPWGFCGEVRMPPRSPFLGHVANAWC